MVMVNLTVSPRTECNVTAHCNLHAPGFKQFSCLSLPKPSLSPRLECCGAVLAHRNLRLLSSSNSTTSASRRQGFTIMARLVSNFCPCDPPSSASQSTGITGMNHHTRPNIILKYNKNEFETKKKEEGKEKEEEESRGEGEERGRRGGGGRKEVREEEEEGEENWAKECMSPRLLRVGISTGRLELLAGELASALVPSALEKTGVGAQAEDTQVMAVAQEARS
ncbi:hypothetical protein AAY473_017303 [Plecturocebus cupreus]